MKNTLFIQLLGQVLLLFSHITYAGQTSLKIFYQQLESGFEPLTVVYTLTPDYLRIDDTALGKDFILLDRKKQNLYAINSEEQRIIMIPYSKTDVESPVALEVNIKELKTEADSPAIQGKPSRHYQLIVNENICHDWYAVEELLPQLEIAMKEFRQTMAGQHARTIALTPQDMIDNCDLALNVFYPTYTLDYGTPVAETDYKGMTKIMSDFKETEVDESLFKLPESYEIFDLSQFNSPQNLKGNE